MSAPPQGRDSLRGWQGWCYHLRMQLGSKANRRRSVQGFSLVEVVIGLLILGISCLALYGAIVMGYTSVWFARENLFATQIIQEKLETIRLYNWEQITDPTFIPATFQVVDAASSDASKRPTTGSGTVYQGKVTITAPPFASNYQDRMKLVTVELRWKTGKVQRQRSLSTLVTLNGLHTFVY